MEQKTFISNGVNIAYRKFGSGAPLIFVHGNGEDGSLFRDIARRLSDNYTVYLPDTRSHGKSGKVQRLSYDDIAEDLFNLIIHEKMDKPTLFGFSDGGVAGLMLAYKHSDALGKLIAAGINLTPQGLKKSVLFILKAAHFLTRSDQINLMLTGPYITEDDLAKITVPTVILRGEKDMVKLEDSQTVARVVAGAQLIHIPKETHISYVENNAKLYDILKGLL
jgi:pimeloyl-ACP methyl ester carboxylesterase